MTGEPNWVSLLLCSRIYTQTQVLAKRKRAPSSIAQDATEAYDTEATKGSDEDNSA